ncbi:MAG: sugar transferase [Acidobacteria bacterium]|nr:sugar transferase [Acidobacteriota bacterium]
MIEKKEKYHTRLLLIFDMAAAIVALPLAYYARNHLYDLFGEMISSIVNPVLYPLQSYFWFYLISLPVFLLFYYYNRNIRPAYRFRNLPRKLLVIGEKILVVAFITGFVSFLFKLEVSRTLVLLYLSVIVLLLVLTRVIFILTHKGARNGYRRILVVGNSPQVFKVGEKIRLYSDRGYTVLGYVTNQDPAAHNPVGEQILGDTEDFKDVLSRNVVDQVIFVGSSKSDLKIFEQIMLICEEQGILTRLSLDFFPHVISKTSLDFIENQPFLTFSPVPEQAFALMFKRMIDIVGATVGLVLSIPFFLVTPLLIKLSSRGPVIYKQVRCGLYGRKFVLYKFRSMIDGAEDVLWEIKHLNEMNGPTFKMRNDPRITPLGRFLRKTSIDELPQFYNVLKGEMSLVGPRAPLPEEVREYRPWQKRRLSVKPGISCLWQISGRNEIDFDEWMKLDLEYIDKWSLWLDFKILLLTIPTVIFCRGAR